MPLAPTDPTATPSKPATDAERVASAVAHLGPLDREALVLRVRGRTLEEIAAITGTTTAMVRVRLGRAAHGVESRVGHVPTDDTPPPHVRRPSDAVVTDAEAGITPMLHDRLAAALEHARTVERLRHRRTARLVQVALDHTPQLASVATVGGLAMMAADVLTSAA